MQTEAIANVNGTSLIPETLEEMATDTDFQQTAERLRRLGQAAMTREEKQKRQRSLDKIGVPSFASMVKVGLCMIELGSCQTLATADSKAGTVQCLMVEHYL